MAYSMLVYELKCITFTANHGINKRLQFPMISVRFDVYLFSQQLDLHLRKNILMATQFSIMFLDELFKMSIVRPKTSPPAER